MTLAKTEKYVCMQELEADKEKENGRTKKATQKKRETNETKVIKMVQTKRIGKKERNQTIGYDCSDTDVCVCAVLCVGTYSMFVL